MAESRADTGERFTDEDVACEKHSLTVYSHLRCPYCHIEQAVSRAESAEARCESYRSALRRCDTSAFDTERVREIVRAALEADPKEEKND